MPLPKEPTIYELLSSLNQLDEGGRGDLGNYLYDILETGGATEKDLEYFVDRTSVGNPSQTDDWNLWKNSGGRRTYEFDPFEEGIPENFENMSEGEMLQYVKGLTSPGQILGSIQYQIENPWYNSYQDDPSEEYRNAYSNLRMAGDTDWEKFTNPLMDIFGGEGIINRLSELQSDFNLSGQIEGLEKESKRGTQLAHMGFNPMEIFRRYKTLQGEGSAEEDILAESEYLAQIGKAERMKGRKAKSIYDELSGKMFGAIGDWTSDRV